MFFYLLLVVPGLVLAKPATHILHEGKFKVHLTCAREDLSCDGFKKSIKHVAKFFENALSLKKEISVAVNFYPFSAESGISKSLAITDVESALSKNNPCFFIPRALCKQIDTCSNEDEIDFTVTINQNKRFYFASDFGENQDGYSAIDTLAHEFVHGMGFSDCFTSGSCNANIVPLFQTGPGNSKDTAKIEFIANSFVSHIHTSKGKKLISYIDKMNDKKEMPLKDATCEIARLTKYHLDILKDVEGLATTRGELYFKTLYGNKVFLRTDEEYNPGASLAHLDNLYKGTRETLMTADAGHSEGVHELKDDKWLTSPFGPLTLEVLATLGYQINPKPLYENSLQGLKWKKV
ncbi:hypothetical protein DSO57_1033662 [Entomophthora muscae]|uniref:Uncharacterized protein n=1 Tax=Entomophthora muscae TaxID=34485 RepID=A0ACC2TN55_9FUNG|nr:hypothetical protein DSO57_1033662 [Entomophthora muscae]